MKRSETLCFCVPLRFGTILIVSVLCLLYLTLSILICTHKQVLEYWLTFEQSVDTSLTTEAFHGVFYSFAAFFIAYTIVSFFGLVSVFTQRRHLIRAYHIINWFFVLLLFTVSVAFWVYFKFKRDVYINDCQDLLNIQNNSTFSAYYTQISIPGKQRIAPGSDKSKCIQIITNSIIGSGIGIFIFNFLQVYWARSIGKYTTSLKRVHQHHKLETKENDSLFAKDN
ncbi:hypothetical protein BY458DRAFT_525924 [Sporodiniella umbellata]|nr:hypothetical protein BY458DRAFT_525924 [Sporodiniella umbellata]